MNKTELVAAFAEKTGTTKKDAETYLNALLDCIRDALRDGDKVQLIGFGTFEARERSAREGRNPRNTDEIITIPACKVPAFRAGKALRDAVNKKN